MKNWLALCLISFLLAAAACEKKPEYESELKTFTSLTTDQDTLLVGETAKLTALATGDNLTYSWKASTGDLLGSGSEVHYLAGICSVGTNIIYCTVTGENRSETKSVTIVVL